MRVAQRGLADFLPLIDWTAFHRRNLSAELRCADRGVAAVGCGDERQALAWLVRTDAIDAEGTLAPRHDANATVLHVPGLADGAYDIVCYDTRAGAIVTRSRAESADGELAAAVGPVRSDLAVAVRGTA